ncbi:unnamed protein product [Acidithrix sp. C25]|nr:unnamed protein product [Acidithrix sp. C25]
MILQLILQLPSLSFRQEQGKSSNTNVSHARFDRLKDSPRQSHRNTWPIWNDRLKGR